MLTFEDAFEDGHWAAALRSAATDPASLSKTVSVGRRGWL